MRSTVEIEDIEGMRQREGIDDVELREAVARLVVGDLVRLTLLPAPGARAGETVVVRITAIRGENFRGRLSRRPVTAALAWLTADAPVAFTRAHIHSLPRGLASSED
jgi:hypothetical protein